MGRGQRSRGDYQGVVYICDEQFVEKSHNDQMKRKVNIDFKNADKNILTMYKIIDQLTKDKKPVIKPAELVKFAERKWKTDYDTFVKYFPEIVQQQLYTIVLNLTDRDRNRSR